MPIVVVGGSGRGVGKTALVCNLVRAMPELDWTAVKITTHEHGLVSTMHEQRIADTVTDTGRYRAAGARRALLVTADHPTDALRAELEALVGPTRNLIVETNRFADLFEPALRLAVAGPPARPHKPSFARIAARADAILSPACPPGERRWFRFAAEEPLEAALLRWIAAQLAEL